MARRRETYVGGGPNKGGILYGGDKHGIFGSSGRRRMGSQMRIYSKEPRRWPRVVLIVALVIIFVACVWQFACGGLPFLKAEEKQADSGVLSIVSQNIDVARQKAGLTGLNGTAQPGLDTQVTISAVGDCTFGKDPDFPDATSFNAFYAANGPAYFFADVLPYTSADNLTIANCEGAFTESNDIQEKALRDLTIPRRHSRTPESRASGTTARTLTRSMASRLACSASTSLTASRRPRAS